MIAADEHSPERPRPWSTGHPSLHSGNVAHEPNGVSRTVRALSLTGNGRSRGALIADAANKLGMSAAVAQAKNIEANSRARLAGLRGENIHVTSPEDFTA